MPFLSWRNPHKVCGLSLPLVPFCLFANTGTFPCGPAWHVLTPSLGPVNIINFLLNMVLFSCGRTNFVTAHSTPTFLQYVPSTSHSHLKSLQDAIRQCLDQVSHRFLKRPSVFFSTFLLAPSPYLVFFLFLHSSLLSGLVQPSYHLHFSTQWTYHHQSLPSLFISFWPLLKPINWSRQEHTCGPTNLGWFNLLQQGRKLSRNVASHQTGKEGH